MKITKKMWGGFSGGRLDKRDIDDGWGGFGEAKRWMPALFLSWKAARTQYEDVRSVEVTYNETKKRKQR